MDNKMDRVARVYSDNILITYDCDVDMFTYPSTMGERFKGEFNERPLWQIMMEDDLASNATASEFLKKVCEIVSADEPNVFFSEYCLQHVDGTWRWYRVGFVAVLPGSLIHLTLTDIDKEIARERYLKQMSESDRLTGLLNGPAFAKAVEAMLKKDPAGDKAGEYAIVFFDILHFKAINDTFGMAEGDRLLIYIADTIEHTAKEGDAVCRQGSDKFVLCTHTFGAELENLIEEILARITGYSLPIEITCNVGIYVTCGEKMLVDSMVDRAILAHSAIKGSYTVKYSYYTEELRNDMLGEQEIVGMMTGALADKHFVPYFQPQYDHSTGILVGAEALVRWKHPERGLISPGIFIPIFEKNGFITKLDMYIFEEVCSFVRKCLDKGLEVVPVSSNFSRHDIFQVDFVESLEEIRARYDVDAKYLRLEITESAIVGSSQQVNAIVKKLHQYGYVVEMDDFGSGYSSLNVLKDIELDILKLDMLFLKEGTNINQNRGGTILSSVVRMAKWLNMPVIAEGVETVEQADFLSSIGCNYIQGYLYSKPLPEEEFEALMSDSIVGETIPRMDMVETLNVNEFWDPHSRETLIFSHYVGGAAIFDYHDGKVELLRVNKKYLRELGGNCSEKEALEKDPLEMLDENNRNIYENALKAAIETGEEQECETWRFVSSSRCENEKICIRSIVKVIGSTEGSYIVFAMIRNVTEQKNIT